MNDTLLLLINEANCLRMSFRAPANDFPRITWGQADTECENICQSSGAAFMISSTVWSEAGAALNTLGSPRGTNGKTEAQTEAALVFLSTILHVTAHLCYLSHEQRGRKLNFDSFIVAHVW